MKSLKELQLLSDPELLKLVSEKQDGRALETLMLRHRTFLKAIVHAILHRPLFEDDAIQRIWLKVWNTLLKNGYEEESHFQNWLRRIATCHCLDELRKNMDREFIDIVDEHGQEFLIDHSKSPEELLIIKDEVEKLLGMLSPKYRDVVVKRYIEEKSVEETAVELNMTERAVNTALSRALQILRKKGGHR